MNKSIKSILLIVGVGLLVYGIYILIIPEASFEIEGVVDIDAQDNQNAYITIGLGLASLLIGFLGKNKQ